MKPAASSGPAATGAVCLYDRPHNQLPLRWWRAWAGCLLPLLALYLIVAGANAAEPAPLVAGQPLIVGSELDYPPFALVNQDQTAGGFTVELWQAVAREAGLNATIRTGPFHEILNNFKSDKVDVMINLAQSEARKEFASFAVPHVTMYGAIFVRKGDTRIRTELDLTDKTLIVLNKDLAHDYAIGRGWKKLLLVDDTAAGMTKLAAGQADAMLVGKLVGLNTLREKDIKAVEPVGARLEFFQKFAFAVKKDRPGSSELLSKLNEALAVVKASGTYDALYEKWFGILEPRRLSWTQVLKYLLPALGLLLLAIVAYLHERRLRMRLDDSNSLLNATLESTADGLLVIDQQHTILAYNQNFANLWQVPQAMMARRNSHEVMGFAACQAAEPDLFLMKVRELGDLAEAEGSDLVRLKDGRCLERSSKPKRLHGPPTGRVWSFRDVTEREAAANRILRFNQELEERVHERTRQLEDASRDLERLSYVASRTGNAVIITDPEGRIEWVNDSFERISGWPKAEVLGKRPGSFLQGKGTDRDTVERIRAALRHRQPIQFELLNYNREGQGYWIEAEICPVFNKAGGLVNFIAVEADVTERHQTAAKLRQQSQELTELNANLGKAVSSRDQFLAAMSHELRTPLNGVLTLSELLLEGIHGPLTSRQDASLRQIQECGHHLLELINDVLDLAKIEAGNVTLEPVQCDAMDLCEASVRLVRATAQKKSQQIQLSVEPPRLTVRADARRMKQMLVNLLSNAIKFTPERGNLGLQVSATGQEIRFEVWDEGIGIPGDQLDRLFKPFVQLDSRLSRQYSGTGLGLALVRQLATLHGGRVEVASEPGKGSQFVVTLPWDGTLTTTKPRTKHEPPLQAPVSTQPLVLVAEDNPTNYEALQSYLEATGFRVIHAEDGVQALARLQADRPDIVLMDIQMPEMDGLEATRRIRQLADEQLRQIPVVALTALAMPGDKERCITAGATAYLTKPMHMRELVTLMHALIRSHKG